MATGVAEAAATVVWRKSVTRGYVLGADVGAGRVASVWFDGGVRSADIDPSTGAFFAWSEAVDTDLLRFDGCASTWRYTDPVAKDLKSIVVESGGRRLQAHRIMPVVCSSR